MWFDSINTYSTASPLVRYNELAPDQEDQNNDDEGEDEGDDDAADEGNAADEAHDGDEAHGCW